MNSCVSHMQCTYACSVNKGESYTLYSPKECYIRNSEIRNMGFLNIFLFDKIRKYSKISWLSSVGGNKILPFSHAMMHHAHFTFVFINCRHKMSELHVFIEIVVQISSTLHLIIHSVLKRKCLITFYMNKMCHFCFRIRTLNV